MDQQNKPDNEIMNIPAEETPDNAISAQNEKDAEFAEAVARANEVLGDDDEEAPTEHVPTEFEKKMAAIPEKKWKLYQIIAGIAVGALTVVALFAGEEASSLFITAIFIALLGPNYFEKQANRNIYKYRVTMCITMAVGLLIMFIYLYAAGKLGLNPTT